MTNTLTDQLKNIPMFRGLPEKDMETLAQEVAERTFAPGETLMRKGDVGDSLFLIVEGGVKIVSEKTPGGTLILNRVGPGETIGEMSLLEQTSRSATVIADSPTKTLELKHEAFLKLLQHRPELGLALIRDMSSRIRFASTYIEKAIDWSKHIAEGNYSAAINSIASAKSGKDNPSDEVKADQLVEIKFRASGHLPQPSQTRQHQIALFVPILEAFEVAPRQWPRADEGHVTAQHVEQLGQFVERQAPQEAADRSQSWVVANLEQCTVRLVERLELIL